MLFMTDRAGYMYYVKTSEGSPWMGAKFAIVNDLKGGGEALRSALGRIRGYEVLP
jgi:hypothetical protein